MPDIKGMKRHIALFVTGFLAAAVIRTYRSMFNQNTWDWAEPQ